MYWSISGDRYFATETALAHHHLWMHGIYSILFLIVTLNPYFFRECRKSISTAFSQGIVLVELWVLGSCHMSFIWLPAHVHPFSESGTPDILGGWAAHFGLEAEWSRHRHLRSDACQHCNFTMSACSHRESAIPTMQVSFIGPRPASALRSLFCKLLHHL